MAALATETIAPFGWLRTHRLPSSLDLDLGRWPFIRENLCDDTTIIGLHPNSQTEEPAARQRKRRGPGRTEFRSWRSDASTRLWGVARGTGIAWNRSVVED